MVRRIHILRFSKKQNAIIREVSKHPPHHIPVLLEATLRTLNPQKGENYLDLTAGYGGHASAVLEKTGNFTDSTLVDRDDYAISHLSHLAEQGVELRHTDFISAANALAEEGRQYSLVLIDLGVSSPQLDQGDRGFSFTKNGPLDMRMDRRQAVSAADVANDSTPMELTRIIYEYGEEPYSQAKKIAEAIVDSRPFKTTGELGALIADTVRGRKGKIHPATRTFQALRIAVNDELGQVERILPLLPKLLKPGGRVGVISFHSLEDRLVKRYFKDQADSGYEAELQILTKKPLSGVTEDVHNPRSRSAKLRAAVKK